MRIKLLELLFLLNSRCLPQGIFRGLVYAVILVTRQKQLIDRATRDPRAAQTCKLLKILQDNRKTVFGQMHRFAEIRDADDFRKRVPIGNYEAFEPLIRRMMAGEPAVLVSEPVTYFATTSGTTSARKFIPVTRSYLAEYLHCFRGWLRCFMLGVPECCEGFPLAIVSKNLEGHTSAGIPYGSLSREISGHNRFASSFLPMPSSCFLIEDFDSKYYVILLLALQTRITTWIAINPSTLMLLCQKLNQFADRLGADLRQGTLDKAVKVSPEMRCSVERRIRPIPHKAERLRSLAARGLVRPVDVWPELAALACWKGGSAKFYLDQFPRYFGNLPVIELGYLATEGAFTFPVEKTGSDGVFSVQSHFCEFVPIAEREADPNNPFPRTLLCDELRVGERYYIIVTGSHGLYRYDLNDVIEVTGVWNHTPRLAFVRRGGNGLSFTGEKVTEWHAVTALTGAMKRTGVRLEGSTLTVRLDCIPRYVFAVEPFGCFTAERCRALLAACEEELQAANSEYAAKRSSGRISDPLLHVLATDSYVEYRKRRVAKGAPDAQVKPPHLMRSETELAAEFVIIQTIDWTVRA